MCILYGSIHDRAVGHRKADPLSWWRGWCASDLTISGPVRAIRVSMAARFLHHVSNRSLLRSRSLISVGRRVIRVIIHGVVGGIGSIFGLLLLLLNLFVSDRSRYSIREELQIVEFRNRCCYIFVLDVLPRFRLGLGDVVGLLRKITEELFLMTGEENASETRFPP